MSGIAFIIWHTDHMSSACSELNFTRCQLMRQCAIYYLLFQQEILKIVNKNVFCKATDVKLISSLFNCVSNHCPSIDMCLNASPMSSMSSSSEAVQKCCHRQQYGAWEEATPAWGAWRAPNPLVRTPSTRRHNIAD